MIDEQKQEQEKQDLDVFQKFYNFAYQCKQREDKTVEFNYCEDNNNNNKLQFSYDKNNANLIPNNINNIDLTSQPIFCCIGGFFVMFSQGKDGNTNVYALNDALINEINASSDDVDINKQDIKQHVFKIKDVQVGQAKKILSEFTKVQMPSEENSFKKFVRNELDFKCVFSEITENDNKQDIEQIVKQNKKRIDVMQEFKKQFNNKPKLQTNKGFSDFEIKGFKDDKKINLRYNDKGETYMLNESYNEKASNLDNEDYYFGQYDLLMACTKSNNGKVNVFATNATADQNPYDNNNNNHDVFAVYNASQEDAKRFIDKLNTFPMVVDNYKNIDSQEKFEQFFQCHCKNNEINIENQEVDTGCCLFNLCGCNKNKIDKENENIV